MCPKLSIFLTIQKPDTVNRHSFFLRKTVGEFPIANFIKQNKGLQRGVYLQREREREGGWRIYDKQRTTLSCGL